MFQDWSNITLYSLSKFWDGFLTLILSLIVPIIVFIVGWFIAILIGKLATGILKKLKFNQIIERGSWDESLAKANIKVDASELIGTIIKWILVIIFLQISASIMGWMQLVGVLEKVVAYLPNIIIAILLFTVTVVFVDIVEKVVRISVEKIKAGYGGITSSIVKWGIWIFAIMIILDQLNIGGILPQAIIFGVIGFLALAGGLAFGLGGKDAAAELIKDFKQKITQK
jgi:hypothetical protein